PTTLEGDGPRLAPCRADIGLGRDAGVRGLPRLRKRPRFWADLRELGTRARRGQEAPNLGLDAAIAALSNPPLRQCSPGIEKVLRGPGVVVEGLPRRKLVVECDRIGEPMIANPSIDIRGALPELELRCV